MLAWKPHHNLLRQTLGWGVGVLFFLSVMYPMHAQEKEAAASLENATSAQLVEQLGANDYQIREAAEAEILTRDEEVIPLIEAARKSPDPEVRMRATAIYRLLSQRLRSERLQRFLTTDDDVELPGWKRFRAQNGDDPATRKLFVTMLENEWDLLDTMEKQPYLIDYLFYQRANKLRGSFQFPNQRQSVNEGSAATMFFVASQPDVRITHPAMEQMRFLLATPQLSGNLQDPENHKPLMSVFEHWLKANIEMGRFTSEMRFVVLATCMRENISSGMVLAKQMLDDRARPLHEEGVAQLNFAINSEQQMMYAMLAIAKLGSRDDIPELEKFFDDSTPIDTHLTVGEQMTTEIRDVALLAVLHLSGKDPKDYGFSRLATDPSFVYNVRSIGFLSADERDAAFEKWEKAQPESKQPAPAK